MREAKQEQLIPKSEKTSTVQIPIDSYLDHPDRQSMASRLREIFGDTRFAPLSEEAFNDLALRIFRYQFERCVPFRGLCRSLGVGADIDNFRQIPCVPTEAFKTRRIACFEPFD